LSNQPHFIPLINSPLLCHVPLTLILVSPYA
jgi:hypothetical protein